MWTIIKFNKKKLEFLKKDLSNKLDKNLEIYIPQVVIQKYNKNKLIKKEFNLLGDYLFCFHKKFNDFREIEKLKFCRGLKYFLDGFMQSQNDIEKFVGICKKIENKNGYLSENFYQLKLNKMYKFSTGPFAQEVFKIISFQKKNINIIMGNLKTTIKRQKFLFNPVY